MIYNNDLIKNIQNSGQGVNIGNGVTISCVGKADDILYNILHLVLKYCTFKEIKDIRSDTVLKENTLS